MNGGTSFPQRRPTQCDRILAIGHDAVVTRSALLRIKRDATTPEETRFFQKVQADNNGCWNWTGSSFRGYGNFRYQGSTHPSHRIAYAWFYGPETIVGLDVDHLCQNRGCVNPLHLEAVTHAENVARQDRVANAPYRTHCKRGHELVGRNALRRPGERTIRCRACSMLRYSKEAS